MDTTVIMVKNLFTNEQQLYDGNKVFEVDPKNHKLSPFFGEIENQSKIYAYDAGHQLQRVAIYTTFQSREAFEDEVEKSKSAGSTKRYTLPPLLKEHSRKVFDKTKFILEVEKEKAVLVKKELKRAAEKVDSDRQLDLQTTSKIKRQKIDEEPREKKNRIRREKNLEKKLKAATTAPVPKKNARKSSRSTNKKAVEEVLEDPDIQETDQAIVLALKEGSSDISYDSDFMDESTAKSQQPPPSIDEEDLEGKSEANKSKQSPPVDKKELRRKSATKSRQSSVLNTKKVSDRLDLENKKSDRTSEDRQKDVVFDILNHFIHRN